MLEEIKAADKPLPRVQQTWLNHLKACDAQGGSSAAYARNMDCRLRRCMRRAKTLSIVAYTNRVGCIDNDWPPSAHRRR